MEKKMNRRVKHTKSVLRTSLLELLKNETINKITVKSICQQAGINRGTFYSHYKSPNELLMSIENDFFTDIIDVIYAKINSEQNCYTNRKTLVSDIVNCIYENADICKLLFNSKSEDGFIKRAINSVFPAVSQHGSDSDLRSKYEYTYVANGCIGIIEKWICDGMKEDRLYITDLIWDMAKRSPIVPA